MVLHAAVGGEPGARTLASGSADPAAALPLVGETGVAATSLFPSGQVEIAGRRYEARVAIGFAEKGVTVRVAGIREFGLVVEVVR
jgi:membrane-bound serine protease (ClpP class)